jgi:hypothetical protein
LKIGWLQPDDISLVAVLLASDAANLVTGAEYEVTGGDSAKVGYGKVGLGSDRKCPESLPVLGKRKDWRLPNGNLWEGSGLPPES